LSVSFFHVAFSIWIFSSQRDMLIDSLPCFISTINTTSSSARHLQT
jgi:hypothetical protein